jgi:hypothetical protein
MQGQNAAGHAGASPAPAVSVLVERPPPGLARGREAGPEWLIALLGGAAVLLALVFYFRVLRRKRRS